MSDLFKKGYLLIFTLIALNIFLSAYWLMYEDIRFDVDISRDFLLIKEMVTTKPLTLIGSHTSIGGIFHGPLWYYLNLPAFYLSKGDPVLIGWFWWGLSIIAIIILYLITKKIFNKLTAALTALLYSASAITNPVNGLKMFFPPYGAVVLFPIFFYLFIKYVFERKARYLAGALFILGLCIQFEMAFGVPILGLSMIFLAYFWYKNKLIKHLIVFPIIFLPLSTFILFDLKHNFLQISSLINYLQSHLQKSDTNLWLIAREKIRGIFSETFFLLTQNSRVLSWIYSILFIGLIFKSKMPIHIKRVYLIFVYFYVGYWLIHLSLKPLWSSYYWPLLPVIVMFYVGFINYLPKKIFFLIYLPLLIWNLYISLNYIKDFKTDVTQRAKNSWAFNKYIADTIYQDAKGDFGYFIFTPERWVYQQWYALEFAQRAYTNATSHPFAKQKLTYLIIVDPPTDRPDTDSMGWRITDLQIKSEPIEKRKIDIIEIQKYNLTEDEIKSVVNPFLLNSTFFR